MIVRIVRMFFKPDCIAAFQTHFESIKHKVRHFEGCHFLELYQDPQNPTIMMTYSHWESEAALENYRHSEVFKQIWAETKPLMAEKTYAFSMEKINEAQ
jgi:hypothetical protein